MAGALVLYGAASEPFPQEPGLFEAAIGLLLVYSVAASGGPLCLMRTAVGRGERSWVGRSVVLLFGCFLLVPLLVGITHGWAPWDVTRDVIPLLYLFLPLLILNRRSAVGKAQTDALMYALAFGGVLIAFRYFLKTGVSPLALGRDYSPETTHLFAYDPSVVFAAIVLPLKAIERFRCDIKSMAITLVMLVGAGLCISALGLSFLRAPLGLTVLAYVVGIWWLGKRRGKAVWIWSGVFALIVAIAIHKQLAGLVHWLAWKTGRYGVDGKFEELHAVWSLVRGSGGALVYGFGWGSVFADPVNTGKLTSFAHSLITYSLLKAGLIGVAGILAYLAWLAGKLGAWAREDMTLALGIGAVVIIGLFFQPVFKTLSFGAILMLISVRWMQWESGKLVPNSAVSVDKSERTRQAIKSATGPMTGTAGHGP